LIWYNWYIYENNQLVYLKEVKINYIYVSSIVDDDLDSSDFKDSMCIFDDIENIFEKK
jgi:hypothetical protein